MLEPLGVALHAVDLGKLQVGVRVGIFGYELTSLMVIQFEQIPEAFGLAAKRVGIKIMIEP